MSVKRVGKFKFGTYKKRFKAHKRRRIPILVANTAKNHFLQGFRQGAQGGGGFTDASRGGWQRRKKITRRQRNKSILVQRSFLRNFIRKKGVLEKSFQQIILGTSGIRYAGIHNEGGTITTENAVINMPQREFIGQSRRLNKKILVILKNEGKRIFK